MSVNQSQEELIVCAPRFLPRERWADADKLAFEINPENRPPDADLASQEGGEDKRMAVSRRVYWGKKGVRLTVGFLDNPPEDLRKRILSHMNAWNKTANVEFTESSTDPQVRIAREADGYWSYLGTDVLSIPKHQATMNLEAFTMNTPDLEFHRVVRHETGHTLGFPHEHMRQALVERLDRDKVIAEFMRTQGWTRQEVINQVLTPLEESSLIGSAGADALSIMCYQLPGRLTRDGKSIPGGLDIDPTDFEVAGALYPKPQTSA